MQNETFSTTVVDFDKNWIDQFGLISGAYDWAHKELQPGQRAIGIRVLPFAGKTNIYKFDIRHHPDKGVTVECEIPARCHTVIRINHQMMIVQETESGEIVQKYLRFMVQGEPVWRLWHQRVYEYHLETTAPGVNYNIFLLQCNQIVRRLSKLVNRDWFYDMKKRVLFSDMRANTPSRIVHLLDTLREKVTQYMAEVKADDLEELGNAYMHLLDYSITAVVEAGAGRRQ